MAENSINLVTEAGIHMLYKQLGISVKFLVGYAAFFSFGLLLKGICILCF